MSTKKIFNTQLHTIITMVGPTNCGKTFFSKNLCIELSNKLRENGVEPNVQYIGSDEIRMQLLGTTNISKYSSRMTEVSYQAFQQLYQNVKLATSFPINAHFVVLDTTGFNKEFRENIQKIAKENHYNLDVVLFDYSKIDHFHKFVENNEGAKYVHNLINEHVKKMHQTVAREIGKDYTSRHTIKKPNQEYTYHIKNLDLYRKTFLDNDKKYLIIGDIHECIDEFKQLVLKYGFAIKSDIIYHTDLTAGTEIICVGDLIDKGNKTAEVIDFFYQNLLAPCTGLAQVQDDVSRVKLHIVRGNHEFAVFNLITDKTREETYGTDFVRKCYSSYYVIRDNPELEKKFLQIYSETQPFLHFRSNDFNGRSFYVTHSPCDEKYIGKIDTESQKNQCYLYADRSKPAGENVMNTISESSFNYPWHIFGHLSFLEHYNGYREDNNNKISIDTGCIYGNKLTAVLCGKRVKNPKFLCTKFLGLQPALNEKLYYIHEKPFNEHAALEPTPDQLNQLKTAENTGKNSAVDMTLLGREQISRINGLAKNHINFISGTISPAKSEDNDLESLRKGLEYYYEIYKRRGFPAELSIQPKFMGSRCNIYLFRDIDKCYMVSRNGYLIRQLDKEVTDKIYKNLLVERKLDAFMELHKIIMMIIDSELMPWKAIGTKLIDETFRTIDVSLQDELKLLKETGFEKYYDALATNENFGTYLVDKNTVSSQDLYKKYGANMYQTFKALSFEKNEHCGIEQMQKYADIYHQQLECYGSDDEIHIKPFGILKIIFEDGGEIIPSIGGFQKFEPCDGQIKIYNLLNGSDAQCEINFADGLNACYEKVDQYYKSLTTEKHMEGIVIKPNITLLDVAPFIKVRNPEYLTIIYGPDYRKPCKYQKLIQQKNVTKKIRASINEFNLGIEMLKIKYDSISKKNDQYVKLLVKFLFEEENGKTIDPRL